MGTLSEKAKWAIRYAKAGWKVFPLGDLSKEPEGRVVSWTNEATNDINTIRAWWSQYPDANIGWAISEENGIMDLDRKGKQNGFDTLAGLFPHELSPTLVQMTPNGGEHHIYNGGTLKNTQSAIGPGIDTKGHRGYILLAPSTVTRADGTVGKYSWPEGFDPTKIAPRDAWVIERATAGKEYLCAVEQVPVVEQDQPSMERRAIDYLTNEAKPAVAFEGGNGTAFTVYAKLKDMGISKELAVQLFDEHYSPRCNPPWEIGGDAADENRHDIIADNAYAYATQNAPGSATPEADFDKPESPEEMAAVDARAAADEVADKKARENQTKAAREAKKKKAEEKTAETLRKNPTLGEAREAECKRWVYIERQKEFCMRSNPDHTLDVQAFDARNARLCKGEVTKFSKLVFDRRLIQFCDALVYKPGGDEFVRNDMGGKSYNMYRPGPFEPIEGDTTIWDEHIAYLFPDEEQRNLLLNWFGWMLQNIEKKPMHALLVAGRKKGTGKSLVATIMEKIVGAKNTSHPNQTALESDFNEWAKKAKLVVIEELQALDRGKAKKTLHELITQIPIPINDKNVKRYLIDNCFGIMAMSNEEAALVLENDDRRYLVLRTLAEPRDAAYYARLLAAINDPAFISAVYFQLNNRDLQGYNGQDRAPMTRAKEEMIEFGMTDLEHWMLDRADEWPLNQPVVCIDDIRDQFLPAHLAKSPNLTNRIAKVLKDYFKGEKLGQIRIGRGTKRRYLWSINGSAVAEIDGGKGIAATYLRTLKDAPQAGVKPADEAAE